MRLVVQKGWRRSSPSYLRGGFLKTWEFVERWINDRTVALYTDRRRWTRTIVQLCGDKLTIWTYFARYMKEWIVAENRVSGPSISGPERVPNDIEDLPAVHSLFPSVLIRPVCQQCVYFVPRPRHLILSTSLCLAKRPNYTFIQSFLRGRSYSFTSFCWSIF